MSVKMETVIVQNKQCVLIQWGHTIVSVFLDLLAMALTVKVRRKCKMNCSDLLAEVQHSGSTELVSYTLSFAHNTTVQEGPVTKRKYVPKSKLFQRECGCDSP